MGDLGACWDTLRHKRTLGVVEFRLACAQQQALINHRNRFHQENILLAYRPEKSMGDLITLCIFYAPQKASLAA